ncbi:MAG: hypothetical protein LBV67_00035 [Streptococcaceae bacterium]|jgi:hypothetical protein|nr:hypothetical protein [Streptococcaceae bacterium]
MARRKSQKRPMKPSILIFVEGVTEKRYFEILNQKYDTKIPVKLPKVTGKQGWIFCEKHKN